MASRGRKSLDAFPTCSSLCLVRGTSLSLYEGRGRAPKSALCRLPVRARRLPQSPGRRTSEPGHFRRRAPARSFSGRGTRFTLDRELQHRDTPKDKMESLSPMGRPSTVKEIADAVMYLT